MSASFWSVVTDYLKPGNKHHGSFTIEAAFVLGVVMFCMSGLIGRAYKIHDTVTGAMILEEVLVHAQRMDGEEMLTELERLEEYGEGLGNPRLWLGAYDLELLQSGKTVSGTATAGDWMQEIELEILYPAEFLRKNDAWKDMKKDWNNDGSGIQAGDEPELYGDPARNSGK